MNVFSAQDLEQLAARGISEEKAESQLACFRNGFPELDIVAPASTKKGILAPKRAEQEQYIAAWQQYLKEGHKINPLIGNAGVSAVPDSARVSETVGLECDPGNHLLMHAMAPYVAGVIGSAVAAGILLGFLG